MVMGALCCHFYENIVLLFRTNISHSWQGLLFFFFHPPILQCHPWRIPYSRNSASTRIAASQSKNKKRKETVQQSTFLEYVRTKTETWSTQEIITPCFVTQKSNLIPNFGDYFSQNEVNSSKFEIYVASNRSNSARIFAFPTATVYKVVRAASLLSAMSRCDISLVPSTIQFPLQLTVEQHDTNISDSSYGVSALRHGCRQLLCT